MIEFLLGLLCGLILFVCLMVVSIYFRRPVDLIAQRAERMIKQANPKNRGFVYLPPDDNEAESQRVREEIIKKNNEMGVDTSIEELQ